MGVTINKLALIAISFAVDMASAFAADKAVKAVPKTTEALFNWSGCYIGGHFGATGGQNEVSDAGDLAAAGFAKVSADTGGFVPGGQIGCNYQVAGKWVFGVQGSLSAFTLEGETQFPKNADFSVKGSWLASATARIGYVWSPWLLYLEGGAAWVNEKYEFVGPSNAPFDFRSSDKRTGWTLGVGLEFAFWRDWSADLKYAHYDFGTKDLSLVDSLSGFATMGSTKQWFDAVTLGFNYHFPGSSWSPATSDGSGHKASNMETLAIDGAVTYSQPYSIYGDFTVSWGPGGLDSSGVRYRVATHDGAYSFLESGNFGPRLYGGSQEVVGQVGYEFVRGSTRILLMTGANYVTGSSASNSKNKEEEEEEQSSNPVPGTAVGWKSLVELYSNPTNKTMVYAAGNYSTAFRTYETEFEIGYAALGPEIYIGPKAELSGDQNYDQYRLGAFISGFKIGKIKLGVSGGYLHDRAQGSGYFVGTDFSVRY